MKFSILLCCGIRLFKLPTLSQCKTLTIQSKYDFIWISSHHVNGHCNLWKSMGDTSIE